MYGATSIIDAFPLVACQQQHHAEHANIGRCIFLMYRGEQHAVHMVNEFCCHGEVHACAKTAGSILKTLQPTFAMLLQATAPIASAPACMAQVAEARKSAGRVGCEPFLKPHAFS